MATNLQRWVQEFQNEWEDKPIEYLDQSGNWKRDSDPLFGSVSNAIKSRNYELTVDELLRISQWKLQSGRNDANITQNSSNEVVDQFQNALDATTDSEAVDELTELSGIGVPMASTVLTVAMPSQYAIVDYRAFRGLAGLKPELFDSQEYSVYSEFLEHFRTYLTRSEAYDYYMTHVREIAADEDLSARERSTWLFGRSIMKWRSTAY